MISAFFGLFARRRAATATPPRDLTKEQDIRTFAEIYADTRPEEGSTREQQIEQMVCSFSDRMNGNDSMSLFSGLLWGALQLDLRAAPDANARRDIEVKMETLEGISKRQRFLIQKGYGAFAKPRAPYVHEAPNRLM